MASVCIYTVNFDDYDNPVTHVKQSYPCKYVTYTTNEDNLNAKACPPMQAKAYKVFPDRCEQLQNYDVLIYIDGNVEIIDPRFVETVVNEMQCGLGLSLHPWRDCPYEEFDASASKYCQKAAQAARAKYLEEGLPEHYGLFWSGFLVHNMRQFAEGVMEAWWEALTEFPCAYPQDQSILSYALWNTDPEIQVFPAQYEQNKWFKIHSHKS